MRKAILKEIDEAGFITFTKEELEEIIQEAYNKGFTEGYNSLPPTINLNEEINIKEITTNKDTELLITF